MARTAVFSWRRSSRFAAIDLAAAAHATRAVLSHRRRAQHQQLPARRASRRASAAAFGRRAAHPRGIPRGQQRRGPVVRENVARPSRGRSSHHRGRSLRSTSRRRELHGIEFEVATDAVELRPRGAVLSSVRVLRDYELQRNAPAEVMVASARRRRGASSWARDRLDGAAGYRLTIEAGRWHAIVRARFIAAPRASAAPDPGAHRRDAARAARRTPHTRAPATMRALANALAFLSYREKFLAGSWRFDTYFGRDTLISALLLAPVLEPEAIESAIASVLDRLAPNGEVAHEEDIGEFAVLRNHARGPRRASRRRSTTTAWSTTISCWHRWRRAGCSTMRAGTPGLRNSSPPRPGGANARSRARAQSHRGLIERTAPFADAPRSQISSASSPDA